MVRRLDIRCSQCREVSEIFLTSEAHVVAFDCPSCGAPLLSYRGRISVLTDKEREEIRSGGGPSVIGKILDLIEGQEGAGDNRDSACDAHCGAAGHRDGVRIDSYRRDIHRISGDDLIELHFMLAGCSDSLEVIRRL